MKNEQILEVKLEIAVFAVAGVIVSAGIIGAVLYGIIVAVRAEPAASLLLSCSAR